VEGRPLAEAELALRAQRGDERAFEQLVRPYEEVAFRVAYLITGSAAEAEDAMQEGFVNAWRALGRFRREESLRPWLLRVVANAARNRRRSGGRRAELVLRAERERGSGDAAPSPETALLTSERRDELLTAVNRLGEKDRLAITCRYFLDLSEEETAATLGWRRGTVKSRLSRALGRLRADLGEDDG
jgi:RNA polymerase sigma factor (sigma-70 family)